MLEDMFGKKTVTLDTVLGSFTKLKTDLDDFSKQNDAEIAELTNKLSVKENEKSRAEKIKANISQLLDI